MAAPKGNTFWINREQHGRPRDWLSVEDMQATIEQYFVDCREHTAPTYIKDVGMVDVKKPRIPTIEGLCRVLGFSDRSSLLNYQKEEGYEDFFHTIKAAKNYIQEQKAGGLINGEGNSTGLIFDLKNNHGYVDKSTLEQTGKDGAPIQVERKINYDELTDEQLHEIIARGSRTAG